MSLRRLRSRRVAAALPVLALIAATFAGSAAADQTSPADPVTDRRPLAAPGTPAPIRPLPICEELQDPPRGACPEKSEYLTITSTGALDGATAAEVTLRPTIPPCATRNGSTGLYSPSPCYSQIRVPAGTNTVGAARCVYLDDATGRLETCLSPYQDTFQTWDKSVFLEGTWRYQHGLELFGCTSVADFGTYFEGGPSGSGQTWPEVAAGTGECTVSMDRTPDNLMGASWVIIIGTLLVQKNGPSGNVTESALAETYVRVNGTLGPFAEDPGPDPDPDPDLVPPTPFTDVPVSSFAYVDIALLYDLGITTGVSATEYGPAGEVTREQMAAFLARMWEALGNDCPDGENPFGDISTGSFAYDAAACIYELGITNGVSATEYDPAGKVTREQMAAFLARMWRALGNDCPTGSTGFTDVAASSFAAADIECIYDLDITTGTSATTYGPAQNVTREQMAAFLGRLYRAQST